MLGVARGSDALFCVLLRQAGGCKLHHTVGAKYNPI